MVRKEVGGTASAGTTFHPQAEAGTHTHTHLAVLRPVPRLQHVIHNEADDGGHVRRGEAVREAGRGENNRPGAQAGGRRGCQGEGTHRLLSIFIFVFFPSLSFSLPIRLLHFFSLSFCDARGAIVASSKKQCLERVVVVAPFHPATAFPCILLPLSFLCPINLCVGVWGRR